MQRTEIHSDWIHLLTVDKTINNMRFLYIVRVNEDHDLEADAEWDGGFGDVKKAVSRN